MSKIVSFLRSLVLGRSSVRTRTPDTYNERIGPKEKQSQAISPKTKEQGFSSLHFLGLALIIGSLAAGISLVSLWASLGLWAGTAWYLFSAALIKANAVAEGTCLEKSIHQLHALAMEVNSGIAAAFLFPLTFLKSYHRAHGDPHGRPILMVNGYLSFGSTWEYQRHRLIQEGFGPIYTMNIGTGDSIENYAQKIERKAREIQIESGRKDLTLIGHSKGGLVCTYYATHLSDQVKDLIIIGSPLAGTPFAHFGLGQDAHEMRLDSKFLQELRNQIKKHPDIRLFQIASEGDEVVSLSSALLPEAFSEQLVLKDMGHLGLIFSSRVADQICIWLKNREPANTKRNK